MVRVIRQSTTGPRPTHSTVVRQSECCAERERGTEPTERVNIVIVIERDLKREQCRERDREREFRRRVKKRVKRERERELEKRKRDVKEKRERNSEEQRMM